MFTNIKRFIKTLYNNGHLKWLLLILAAVVSVATFYLWPAPEEKPTSINALENKIKENRVEKVVVIGSRSNTFTYIVTLKTDKEEKYRVKYYVPEHESAALTEACKKAGVEVIVTKKKETLQYFMPVIETFLFLATMIFLFSFIGKAFSEAIDEATSTKMDTSLDAAESNITFKDVVGIEEAKESLYGILNYLKDPKKFTKLGSEPAKGALFEGPPGVGKTHIVRALAGEAGVPVISLVGADFTDKFLGAGAERVRKAFKQARKFVKKHGACIIFIDEIEAIGRKREDSHRENSNTLGQLLKEMDGFEKDSGIYVIGATNMVDELDTALIRPGRFDDRVSFTLPEKRARKELFELTVKKRNIPISDDVDFEFLAALTPGLSFAEIVNLINKATIIANNKDQDVVTMRDFDLARDQKIMGAESPLEITAKDLEVSAYHESGHAVLGLLNEDLTDPVYKATIVPRSGALGMVVQVPTQERFNMTDKYVFAQLCTILAGRQAERIKYNKLNGVSTGASNDFEKAQDYATKVIFKYGMAENKELRDIGYGLKEAKDGHFNFGLITTDKREALAKEADKLLHKARDHAHEVLTEQKNLFEEIAQALLKKKTLTRSELLELKEKHFCQKEDKAKKNPKKSS